jgi:hypothetical protein
MFHCLMILVLVVAAYLVVTTLWHIIECIVMGICLLNVLLFPPKPPPQEPPPTMTDIFRSKSSWSVLLRLSIIWLVMFGIAGYLNS